VVGGHFRSTQWFGLDPKKVPWYDFYVGIVRRPVTAKIELEQVLRARGQRNHRILRHTHNRFRDCSLGCDFFERVRKYACTHWNIADVPVFFFWMAISVFS
jgi:hypothetical protein